MRGLKGIGYVSVHNLGQRSVEWRGDWPLRRSRRKVACPLFAPLPHSGKDAYRRRGGRRAGRSDGRMVSMLEFPNMQHARDWYSSADYQKAIVARPGVL